MRRSKDDRRHDLGVLVILLSIRAINALSVKTFFQPDEYFQSLEPAWQLAFGDESGAWLTWEWREGLRSSLHPLAFAAVYRATAQLSDILSLNNFARSELLIASPKLLQAGLAAAMDFSTYKLACRTYGHGSNAAYAALALTTLSPWQAFCSVRTLSNSLETTLTILALCMWPWDWFVASARSKTSSTNKGARGPVKQSPRGLPKDLYLSLASAALACILRPTNIMVWATVSITLLLRHGSLNKLLDLAQAAFISGGSILAVSLGADRMFYEDWVFPPLRFLQFNLVQSLAVFYGQNRPDYYFTEGLPLLLTTAIPFAVVGMWQGLRFRLADTGARAKQEQVVRSTLAVAVTTSVITLSLISHKEVRFIYPLLPILHVLAAKPMASFFAPWPQAAPTHRRILLLLIVCINASIGYYVLLVHQRGVVDVMHYLRHKHGIHLHSANRQNMTVGFLMPCHSTPWRSHLVYPGIDAWALTCEPPLNLTIEERKSYMDEADVFYEDYAGWLHQNMDDISTIDPTQQRDGSKSEHTSRRTWPDHLVFFEKLEEPLSTILNGSAYHECWRGFNTHWHDDRRRQGHVIIWCKT